MYNHMELSDSAVDFVDIGPAHELPPGERMFVEVEGLQIVVFNIAESLYAIADVCSHDDGPVGEGNLEDFSIACPRHGAQFDVRTGKVLQMPAVDDIPAYPIRVVEGMMQLGIPRSE